LWKKNRQKILRMPVIPGAERVKGKFKANVDKAIGNFLEFYLNNADGKVEKRESATKLFIGR